jgi:hypothetical protein
VGGTPCKVVEGQTVNEVLIGGMLKAAWRYGMGVRLG